MDNLTESRISQKSKFLGFPKKLALVRVLKLRQALRAVEIVAVVVVVVSAEVVISVIVFNVVVVSTVVSKMTVALCL